MTHPQATISAVVPAYTSEPGLPELVRRLQAVLETHSSSYELIFVDCGGDGTWQVIEELADAHGWIRGVHLARSDGKHNPILTGIRLARNELIVTLDDALLHPPEEIPLLLERLTPDVDVVYRSPEKGTHGLFRTKVRDAFAGYDGALSSAPDKHVEIVVPVYNEERDLEPSIRRLRGFLDAGFPFPVTVTIADNGSTDGTQAIGKTLAATVSGVRYMRITDRGRGWALAAAWLISDADIVAYTDVDLSTDLEALLPLLAPVISGHADVAIGSRLAENARVQRGFKREFISRSYNNILRFALGAKFKDAQCGFKAIRADIARQLVPKIENRNWFFDTELLVLAQRAGLRIHEVPVVWTDDPDSKVRLVRTAVEDLLGVWRLRRRDRRVAPDLRPSE